MLVTCKACILYIVHDILISWSAGKINAAGVDAITQVSLFNNATPQIWSSFTGKVPTFPALRA